MSKRVDLDALVRIVAKRADADPADSYTASLAARGVEHAAKKFGEEAVETVIAALSGDREELAAETADTLYHLAVLLHISDVSIEDVYAVLANRTGQSGHAEKASRGKG